MKQANKDKKGKTKTSEHHLFVVPREYYKFLTQSLLLNHHNYAHILKLS